MPLTDALYNPVTLVALIALAGTVFLAWPRSEERRRQRVEKWATTKLVPLTPEVATALQKALAGRDRFGAATLTLLAAGSIPVMLGHPDRSTSISAVWTLATTCAVVSMLTTAWRLARPWFAVDAVRSARVRSVSLHDYVFPPVRWLAWCAALVCLAASVLVLLPAPSLAAATVRAAPLIGVVVTTAAAEWVGRRTVQLPQPAQDAAELYALDAWRCELASDSFQALPLLAVPALVVSGLSWPADDGTMVAFQLMGWALLGLVLLFQRFPEYSMTWTRHRLWPELPDETIIETKAAAL
jgi:hypothetical protein